MHWGKLTSFFDKDNKPYASADDFANWFEISKSTLQGRAKLIRESLKVKMFDHEWMLDSLIQQDPAIWFLQVNGFIVDIREMPLEVQQQAYDKGLIPYIPMIHK